MELDDLDVAIYDLIKLLHESEGGSVKDIERTIADSLECTVREYCNDFGVDYEGENDE